jgi:hypothetical protein
LKTGNMMQTLLYATFLKPGMLDLYKEFIAEIMGPRNQEYKELLKRYGIRTTKVWHEKVADRDYVMVMHEAEGDALERSEDWESSTHPFDLWFEERLNQCYETLSEPADVLFQFDGMT